ncbi:MAG: hypothetical protein SF028_10385 [Candidatus Sumerlaeia bacterium]|nr:hypothetical protein [Candidatus Sumerlaeia bacterium]
MASKSVLHREDSAQHAIVRLRPGAEADHCNCFCRVTLITPETIRLETSALSPEDGGAVFNHNEIVEVYLPLPDPCPAVQTRARVLGVLVNYERGLPPVTLDLGFVQLTPQEEERLRDSNPGLFRLPLVG